MFKLLNSPQEQEIFESGADPDTLDPTEHTSSDRLFPFTDIDI